MLKMIKFEDKNEIVREKAIPLWFIFDSSDGVLRDGQSGFGSVRYLEGSVYTGNLIYHGGLFDKFGYGEQDFTHSLITARNLGLGEEYHLYKFIGNYDYRICDWIYGNGVIYFLSNEGFPKAFVKGFFIGLSCQKKYKGRFDSRLLLPGFSMDMELDTITSPRKHRIDIIENKLEKKNMTDTLLVGDSRFEFYEGPNQYGDVGPFLKDSVGKDVLNIGIGGTTYSDWIDYFSSFIAPLTFSKVIVNLGFNDIHSHLYGKARRIFGLFQRFIGMLLKKNPSLKIYVLGVSPSLGEKGSLSEERKLNELEKNYCDSDSRLSFIDVYSVFFKENGEYVENFGKYFIDDGIHLNGAGYNVWTPLFKKYF
jgi:lysophospholipase L1-like esterase